MNYDAVPLGIALVIILILVLFGGLGACLSSH